MVADERPSRLRDYSFQISWLKNCGTFSDIELICQCFRWLSFIADLRLTRSIRIDDITVFNLLKSLTSGRINLSKMRLEFRFAYKRISYFVKVKVNARYVVALFML